MYLLLFLSIVVWTVAISKYLLVRQVQSELGRLFVKLTELVGDKKLHEAKGACHHFKPALTRPLMSVLEGPVSNFERWQERVFRRARESQMLWKKYLWILGTVGALAPFVGLFGTVVGIIKSFEFIALSGKSGFAVVAAGISEALVATAAGILVAVVAVFLYNFLQVQLSNLDINFRHHLQDLMDLMVESKRADQKENGDVNQVR